MRSRATLICCAALAAASALSACGLQVIGLGGPPPEIDQVNPLEGAVVAQRIGWSSDVDGSPDPSGRSFDLQDAQTFTAGADGQLTFVQVAILNDDGATDPVVLEIREVELDPVTLGPVPTEDDSLAGVVGRVELPADAFVDVDLADPDTWPGFDVSVLGMVVTAGTTYSFSLRTTDTAGFSVSPEVSMAYVGGAAWRRNRAVTSAWTEMLGADFGFRTWVWER